MGEPNPGKTIVVDFPKVIKRPNVKLWVNTPLFMNIWKKIKEAGVWNSYDWTVKVDPYTVFVPQRLRNIVFHQPVTNKGVYLENCKHVRMGFHGSLEVISKGAWGIFMNNLDTCHSELPWEHGTHTHFRYYGEDKFLAWCLHLKGVGRVPSRQETLRVPLDEMIYGLHITVSCPHHTTKGVKDKNFTQATMMPCVSGNAGSLGGAAALPRGSAALISKAAVLPLRVPSCANACMREVLQGDDAAHVALGVLLHLRCDRIRCGIPVCCASLYYSPLVSWPWDTRQFCGTSEHWRSRHIEAMCPCFDLHSDLELRLCVLAPLGATFRYDMRHTFLLSPISQEIV